MLDQQFENISTSLAELIKSILENDITELEQEIFYNKVLVVKELIDSKKG